MLLAILILQALTLLAYVASLATSLLYMRRSERRSVADQVAHERRMSALDSIAVAADRSFLGSLGPRAVPRPAAGTPPPGTKTDPSR
jgi:hypothetical protein